MAGEPPATDVRGHTPVCKTKGPWAAMLLHTACAALKLLVKPIAFAIGPLQSLQEPTRTSPGTLNQSGIQRCRSGLCE